MHSHSSMVVMIMHTIISCTCNTRHGYTIIPDTVISCVCRTITHIMLHWTLLFHVHVSLRHEHAITLDIVTRLLCTQLFHVLISLLHRCTCIHTLIVFIFLLHGSLLMLHGLLVHDYSCILVIVCLIQYIVVSCF